MKLVSLIIPSFNRAKLITETLESVIQQSYSNWECIVVDDGSSDTTLKNLKEFSIKDNRIKYYSRPKEKVKGANTCRNFGFEQSSGDYIIWFDSDDLMTQDHIERKLKFIEENKLDFAVARTRNFREDQLLKPYKYIKKPYGIKASDFILLKIHWYTYDVIISRQIAEQIEWNDKMKSWQDYNYFCKMLLITEKGDYMDDILTHRRLHDRSIQAQLTATKSRFTEELLENRILTFLDIHNKVDKYTRKELLFGLMNLGYEMTGVRETNFKLINCVQKKVKYYFGWVALFYYNLALMSGYLFNKGYFFLERSKNRND